MKCGKKDFVLISMLIADGVEFAYITMCIKFEWYASDVSFAC